MDGLYKKAICNFVIKNLTLPSISNLLMTIIIIFSFACAGVTNKKRMLLLPWLIVYMMFKILLIASFISDVLFNPFNVSQIFLLCLLLLVMSAWRHMQVSCYINPI